MWQGWRRVNPLRARARLLALWALSLLAKPSWSQRFHHAVEQMAQMSQAGHTCHLLSPGTGSPTAFLPLVSLWLGRVPGHWPSLWLRSVHVKSSQLL